MTCDECQRILLDGISGQANEARTPGASRLALAELHAQSCLACANWPSDLARLHAGFDELRVFNSQTEAPARVERNLLSAFRDSTRPNRSLVGTNFRQFALALAAAILLLGIGIALHTTTTLGRKPNIAVQGDGVRRDNKSSQAVLGKQRSSVSFGGHAQVIRKHARGRANHRRPADNLVARGNQASEQMMPVRGLRDEQLSLNGGSSIIRVNVPLSSLAAVGVPMYADLPDRQVTADVARDPFGAIIAIRLVGVKPGNNAANW